MRYVRSVAPMRIAKFGYIFISILMCILGAVLIAAPDFSEILLGSIFGILLILFGCVRLVGFFSKDLYRLAFQYDLAFGILAIVIGIAILLHPKNLMAFIYTTLGIFILADSVFKIQIALDSKKFGIGTWWLILIFAIITGLLGIVLIFLPAMSAYLLCIFLGITLLLEGILNLNTVISAVKIIKHQRPDVIEIDYYKESED